MKAQASISPVYKLAQERDPDPMATYARIDRLRRLAWQKQGIVVITIGELPAELQAAVRQWAEDNYGQR